MLSQYSKLIHLEEILVHSEASLQVRYHNYHYCNQYHYFTYQDYFVSKDLHAGLDSLMNKDHLLCL